MLSTETRMLCWAAEVPIKENKLEMNIGENILK